MLPACGHPFPAFGGEIAKVEDRDGTHYHLRGSSLRYSCPRQCGGHDYAAAPALQPKRDLPGTVQ